MPGVQYLDNVFGEEMKHALPAETTIARNLFVAMKEHLYSDLNGEAVILSIKNGKYYGLNGVGRSIWNAVREPAGLEGILASVMSEYEVDEEICQREVQSFLKIMVSEGLIEVLDDKAV
jgi:hypothetical protein